MLLTCGSLRYRRRLLLSIALFAGALWFWSAFVIPKGPPRSLDAQKLQERFPLAWEHIHSFNGTGGAWFIPPEWIGKGEKQPQTIIEAARLASKAAASSHQRQVSFSNIPLIVHQKWNTAQVDTWKAEFVPCVEQWLKYATSPGGSSPMAYFLWDNEGVFAFMREYESEFYDDFVTHFEIVEQADIFRILVCKWFGGVYADVDTEPLQHPSTWIRASDIASWTDSVTGESYGVPSDADVASARPVNLLWGLEADTDPASDSYWRMGYSYPVQLTQWALASAPEHPVFTQFMSNLIVRISETKNATLESESGSAAAVKAADDPLTRTGPAAVTVATSSWLETKLGFRWNALTGLHDGGRAKLVSDVLVLPITGFSPGRGAYGNMGSKPITHPDARLLHHALGSWRHFDLVVEYGKFCRTVFGWCRDWSKVTS